MANLRVCAARGPIPDAQYESVWAADADQKDKLCAQLPFDRNETASARHADGGDKQGGDPVADELKTIGEQGLIILRAREEVIEILSGQNQCAGWFERTEPDAVRKFRSLRYRIEEGPEYTLKIQGGDGVWRYQQPYVASSFEDAGEGSTITINGRGAFFQLRSGMRVVPADGGPGGPGASQLLHLDLYVGGTLRAQVVALLHELSHVAGLLPADGGSFAGQEVSTQNTQTMLGHCRTQVEAVGKHKIRKDGLRHPEDLPTGSPESGN